MLDQRTPSYGGSCMNRDGHRQTQKDIEVPLPPVSVNARS
jgi:hypothetical protein